jgi:hypothetical protein
MTTSQAVTHIQESRWFELMYTPQGKPDTHDTYASYVSPRTPHARFPRTVPVRDNLSCWPNGVGWTLLLLRKKAPDTIPSTLVDQSACLPHSFSLLTTIEVVIKLKHMLMNKLQQFIVSISPKCDQYVQYLLVGANPSVLNGHKWGLQPWRCQLSTSLSPHFPTDDSPLSPKIPARSQVNHPTVTNWTKEIKP